MLSTFTTSPPLTQSPEVILYGSCGTDNSWRQPFKDACLRANRSFFDPFIQEGWQIECLEIEAHVLYNSRTVMIAVHSETHGYGSLAEMGWALVSSLIDRKSLNFYVEAVPDTATYNDEFLRTRQLVISQARKLNQLRPGLCYISDTYTDFVTRGIGLIDSGYTRRSQNQLLDSQIAGGKLMPEIAIFGTTESPTSNADTLSNKIGSILRGMSIPVYLPWKSNWKFDDHHAEEMDHKFGSEVLLQCIDAHQPSYGSLVETGMLVATSILLGRSCAVLIKDYVDPETQEINKYDYPNRLRQMVRYHLDIVAAQCNGLIYVADTEDALIEFAQSKYRDYKQTDS